MAKPDLDDGYLRYAHELDAALSCADFTKGARIVLREVFSQTFGPARLRTAKLSPTELSRIYGSNKGYFGHAIKELVVSGALEKLGEVEYRFLKDYETWTKNGHSRLSDREIELARLAPKRAMAFKQFFVVNPVNEDKPKQQTLLLDSVVNPDNDHQSDRQEPVVNPDNEPVASIHNEDEGPLLIDTTPRCESTQRHVVNPDNEPHYIERARGIETRRQGDTHTAGVSAPEVLGPEYTAVGELAMELSGNVAMGSWVSRMGHLGFPVGWIRAALESGAAANNLDGRYLHGILRRYESQDGPDKKSSSVKPYGSKTSTYHQPPPYVKGSLK